MKFELDPKFEKAWEYVNTKMDHIDDVEFVKFCLFEKPSMAIRWTAEERAFMLDAWYVIKTGSCAPENKVVEEFDKVEERVEEVLGEAVPDFDAMTKKELDEWASENGIELDRRKNKANMLKELEEKLSEK